MNFLDLHITTDNDDAGERLDKVLMRHLHLSRRKIRRAIDLGGVYVNRRRCRIAGRLIKGGERLRLVMLDGEPLIDFSAAQLLWYDNGLYLIHKRSGQYAQAALHRSQDTLPQQLAHHLGLSANLAGQLKPVHRLDRDTSGLMLLAASAKQLQNLQGLWHTCVEKHYLAVVEPAPAWQNKRIRQAISRRRGKQGRYAIDPHGRACDTEARVLERRGNRALLHLIAHTGRTHQLRVHLAHAGSPILGDHRYGGAQHARLMLHSYRLCVHPPALPKPEAWQAEPEEDWQW